MHANAVGVARCSSLRLRVAGTVAGTLCFLDDHTEPLFEKEDIHFLSLLAMRLGAEIERERTVQARLSEQQAYAATLKETAKQQRQFVSMIIHDLRHPLTAMRTSLYLLRIESDYNQRLACSSRWGCWHACEPTSVALASTMQWPLGTTTSTPAAW
jgi:signal transduction histidine kinase